MQEVMKLAKKELKPTPKIFQLEVYENNKPAIGLYKKMGFKIVAKVPKQIQHKDLILDTLRKEMKKLNNKIRFVTDVIAGTIPVYKLKKTDLEARLVNDDYDHYEGTYDYLTKIPIYNFTTDKVAELQDDIRKKEATVSATENMTGVCQSGRSRW